MATSTVSGLGLPVDDAVLLQSSNKVTLRLLPCDVVARVAPVSPIADQVARSEIEIARGLAASGSPVAALDPRVEPRPYERDGFLLTLWTYYAPATPPQVPPADYARALARLHAGMRTLDVAAPHVMERAEQAEHLVARRDRTPRLADDDRELLASALRSARRAVEGRGGAEQLLHGEPHPGNLLATRDGPRFIDLETCCRGPVEFDLAHAPEAVGEHYPGADQELLRQCRVLVLAIVTTWRWDRADQLPDGQRLGVEWLGQLRAAVRRSGPDASR